MLIDGLQCGYFTRDVFSTLKEGGFTCVTSTLGFLGRIASLARCHRPLAPPRARQRGPDADCPDGGRHRARP